MPLLNYARYLDDPKLLAGTSSTSTSTTRTCRPGSCRRSRTSRRRAERASARRASRPARRSSAALINALMRSRDWNSSAFLLAYDDWGGWYDHVKPPQVDATATGSASRRSSSARTRARATSTSTTLDFTSICGSSRTTGACGRSRAVTRSATASRALRLRPGAAGGRGSSRAAPRPRRRVLGQPRSIYLIYLRRRLRSIGSSVAASRRQASGGEPGGVGTRLAATRSP